MNDTTCPIWWTSCQKIALPEGRDGQGFNSPRAGGKYIVTGTAFDGITALDKSSKVKLSRWIYEQNQLEEIPEIDRNILEKVKTRPMPSVHEQMDYCLQFLESKAETLGEYVKYHSYLDEMQAASLLKHPDEIGYLIEEIEKNGWISILNGPVKIISKGHQRLEELKKTNVASDQAFVAMWLDRSMNDVWEKGLEPGIQDAGYKALRIDRSESNDKIDDAIIAEIRRSRFLVADFTSPLRDARGSVYYEAGFAHGLNIPVIFTCRKDLIDRNHLHFDTRQYSHIAWEKSEDLRKRLKDRISATIGDRPHRDKNP